MPVKSPNSYITITAATNHVAFGNDAGRHHQYKIQDGIHNPERVRNKYFFHDYICFLNTMTGQAYA
jgi:hypothetical protein